MSGTPPPRPVLRWLGGKYRLAPWICAHLPPHHTYVEPFGGAASVLLSKPRSPTEIYNDLDDDVVTLFRVLRSPEQAAELVRQLRLTPYARAEFLAAYEPAADAVERERRLVVRSFMGFGSCAARRDRSTGFRTGLRGANGPAAGDWSTYPDALEAVIRRLSRVIVDHQPASRLLRDRDGEGVLFYVDPPYVHATRNPKRTRTAPSSGYTHELTDADHQALLAQLRGLRGLVVLSGYPHPLYDEALGDWRRATCAAMADGGRPRTEVLWINPAAAGALDEAAGLRRRGAGTPLFEGVAA